MAKTKESAVPAEVLLAYKAGVEHLENGELEKAKILLWQAVEQYPHYARCRFLLLVIYHLESPQPTVTTRLAKDLRDCRDIADLRWQLEFVDVVLARLIRKLSLEDPKKLFLLQTVCWDLREARPASWWRGILQHLSGQMQFGRGQFDMAYYDFLYAGALLSRGGPKSRQRFAQNAQWESAAALLRRRIVPRRFARWAQLRFIRSW